MSKKILTQSQNTMLQILAIDWLMVGLGVLWLILLWVYGATPWQIIILGFGTVMWWSAGHWWVTKRQKITHKIDFFLSESRAGWGYWWLVWLFGIILNVFTSVSFAQSSQRVFWWIMCGLWFWWWISIVNQKLRTWLASQILCIGLLILTVSSWLAAWFRPSFIASGSFDFSPSFLLPFFGHHHIAALIVLIWPLWWVLKQWLPLSAKNLRWSTLVWLAALGGTVWFAFSRSAWLALLLQVGIIFWFYRAVIKRNLKIWVLSGGIFVMVVLSGFLLKHLMQSQSFAELPRPIRILCHQWWSPESLCSVAPEPRLEYWKQAIVVWREFSWFGSGLDTFGQVTKRWQTSSLFQTQYTHQSFLQVLSEQGVLGFIVWLSFFGVLFFEFYLHVRYKTALENWPFFLSISGALVIGSFDFDWQLAGFWWPFLLVVSCVVVLTETTKNIQILKLFFIRLGCAVALMGALVSLITYCFLVNNKADELIRVWPYSFEWQSLTVQKIKDRKLWHTVVQRYYRHSPEVWFRAMTDVVDSNERWVWLEQLWQLDPWRYWETNPMATAQNNQSLNQTMLVLSRLRQWVELHPDSKIQSYNPAFATELFMLADQSLQQENWQLAEDALLLAQIFDPWVLHNRLLSTVRDEVIPEKPFYVFEVFSHLNQKNYGDHLLRYRLWYRKLALAETNRLLEQRAQLVGNEPISAQWLPLDKAADLSDWVDSVERFGAQSLILLPDPQSRGAELSQKLSALMIEAGDATVSTKNNRVNELYAQAQKIEPWVLNGKLWWFERLRLIKPSTKEFLVFAQDWSRGTAKKTGYKPQAWILFYNRVLLLSLRAGNFAAAFESLESIKHYLHQAKTLTTL